MIGKPSKANQMLRSNSSHGGFSGINSQNNASVTKSPSNNQVCKLIGLLKKVLESFSLKYDSWFLFEVTNFNNGYFFKISFHEAHN